MILYIRDNRNIVIYGLSFRRTDYDLQALQPTGLWDILRSDGATDCIWIAHNDFALCGHGCFDIVVTPDKKPWPAGFSSRITVAFNRFRSTDRVMIYGFTDSLVQQTSNCTSQGVSDYRDGPTLMFLTLQGNIFEDTAQRMPRASGRAFAHVNNVFAFQPLRYPDGRAFTSSYAAAALSGASPLVEQNWFGQLTKTKNQPLAGWTISTPGGNAHAERKRRQLARRRQSDGHRRNRRRIAPANCRRPGLSSARKDPRLHPSRRRASRRLRDAPRRAGPDGAVAWDVHLCGN